MTRSTTAVIMYDAVSLENIPLDAPAVAGYVNGHWPTFSDLAQRFPGAQLLSITVTAEGNANCLDVENGDATAAQVPGWVQRQPGLGTPRPCLYASASAMGGVLAALQGAGISLSTCRFWSAHYTGTAHICGPDSCGAVDRLMDGTQWTDSALGRNLDQSLVDDGFFGEYDELMTQIPVIQLGSTGQTVKNWQALLIAREYSLTMDGDFGPDTEAATRQFQGAEKTSEDGIVGTATWTAALTA